MADGRDAKTVDTRRAEKVRVSSTFLCPPESTPAAPRSDAAPAYENMRNAPLDAPTPGAMSIAPRPSHLTFGPNRASQPAPPPIPNPRVVVGALLPSSCSLPHQSDVRLIHIEPSRLTSATPTRVHCYVLSANVSDRELLAFFECRIDRAHDDHPPVLVCGSLTGRLAEAAGIARAVATRAPHPSRPDAFIRDLVASIAQEHVRHHPRHALAWARTELTAWVESALAPLILSHRMREVIALSALGLTQAQVGAELGVDVRTVEAHVARFLDHSGADRFEHVIAPMRDAVNVARTRPSRPQLRPDRASIPTPRLGSPLPRKVMGEDAGDY